MPGHVKKSGKQEQDPDPSPWLILSFEMKKEDSLKPYGEDFSFYRVHALGIWSLSRDVRKICFADDLVENLILPH